MNTTDYAKENPLCELTGQRAEHVHHIWGGRQRLDLRSNLIRLSVSAHDLCHTEIVRGRCLCMLAKLVKGEFDLNELDAAAGQSVLGWIEMHKDHGEDSRRLYQALATHPSLPSLRKKNLSQIDQADTLYMEASE